MIKIGTCIINTLHATWASKTYHQIGHLCPKLKAENFSVKMATKTFTFWNAIKFAES